MFDNNVRKIVGGKYCLTPIHVAILCCIVASLSAVYKHSNMMKEEKYIKRVSKLKYSVILCKNCFFFMNYKQCVIDSDISKTILIKRSTSELLEYHCSKPIVYAAVG